MPDRRVNTFTQSPSWTQIVAYVAVFLGIFVFYTCITPNFQNAVGNVVLSVLYGISASVLILFAFLSSYIDPSDPVVETYFVAVRQNKRFDNKGYLYCGVCESYCSQSSKHCRKCKRCVYGFDHHCIWINNCIGESNYKYFVVMISLVLVKLGLFLVAAIWMSLENMFREYLAAMIACWIYCLIAVVLAFLDLNLLILHIYLNVKGITTFQMLQIQKQDQREKRIKAEIKRVPKIQDQRTRNEIKLQSPSPSRPSLNQQQLMDDNVIKEEAPPQLNQQKTHKKKEINFSPSKSFEVPRVLIMERIPQNVSVQENSLEQLSNLSYAEPNLKVSLSEFIKNNKSMKFIVSNSLCDIQEPKRVKTIANQ